MVAVHWKEEKRDRERCMGRTAAVSCIWNLSLGLTLRRVSALPGFRVQHQTPSVCYQGALTAAFWRSSHHCPFKEGGEAEIVCGLPEVLQLVSAGLGREPRSLSPEPHMRLHYAVLKAASWPQHELGQVGSG